MFFKCPGVWKLRIMGVLFQTSSSLKLKDGTVLTGRVTAVAWCDFCVSTWDWKSHYSSKFWMLKFIRQCLWEGEGRKLNGCYSPLVSLSCKCSSHEKSKFLGKKECLLWGASTSWTKQTSGSLYKEGWLNQFISVCLKWPGWVQT